MKKSYECELGAAMLAVVPVGERPTGGTCSVATVVISSDREGDRSVENLEVKVSDDREKYPARSAREASNLTGRSE